MIFMVKFYSTLDWLKNLSRFFDLHCIDVRNIDRQDIGQLEKNHLSPKQEIE